MPPTRFALSLAAAALVWAGQPFGLVVPAVAETAQSKPAQKGEQENIVAVSPADARMNAAIAEARQSLPEFLSRASAGQAEWESVGLKVMFATVSGSGPSHEHIWIADFAETAQGRFSGYLANEPVWLGDRHMGDAVEFGRDDITDWALVMDGRGYGFFTARALLDQMAPDQRRELESFLAPQPIHGGW